MYMSVERQRMTAFEHTYMHLHSYKHALTHARICIYIHPHTYTYSHIYTILSGTCIAVSAGQTLPDGADAVVAGTLAKVIRSETHALQVGSIGMLKHIMLAAGFIGWHVMTAVCLGRLICVYSAGASPHRDCPRLAHSRKESQSRFQVCTFMHNAMYASQGEKHYIWTFTLVSRSWLPISSLSQCLAVAVTVSCDNYHAKKCQIAKTSP